MAKPSWKWIVEVKLGAQPSNCCGVSALADHRFDRVARRDVQQQKRDNEHAEQRRDAQEEAP
jgi:hypothetical protein